MPQKHKQNIIYQAFRVYLRFFHDKIFYRKVHLIGTENIPAEGAPLLIACNHQNCLNDPLAIVMSFHDRKPRILVRADVFEYNSLTRTFLSSIGLLPAFRMNYEGEESLSKNESTFSKTEQSLIDGNTIIIFPEAKHQDKRWLGSFSSGFTKIAFDAAKRDNFKTDVQILPTCNHYSNYYGIQNEVILKFGKPISIAPYYELYKTKPRTAQRQVIELVHKQIDELMLNITDLDNYKAFDCLRAIASRRFATANNLNPDYFPDMLESDKLMFAKLEQAKAANNYAVQYLYDDTLKYNEQLQENKITDTEVEHTPTTSHIVADIVALVVLLPVWIVSLWPNVLIYNASDIFMRKIKDKMFEGTIRYSLSVLLTIPLLYILTFCLATKYVGWLFATFYLCMLPALAVFAINYWNFVKRTVRRIRYCRVGTVGRDKLSALRNNIIDRLLQITNQD